MAGALVLGLTYALIGSGAAQCAGELMMGCSGPAKGQRAVELRRLTQKLAMTLATGLATWRGGCEEGE